MSEQVNFAIRPNGGSLEIEIQGDGIAQPNPIFARQLPNFAAPQLDIFRTGDAKGKDLDDLQKAVTDWLLGPDLKPLLNQWIGLQFPPRMRLVFKLDSRVQSTLDDLPFELIRIDPAPDPVVIHPRVENFVYALPPSAAAASTAALDWPMRILMVRSNPADLGGDVPPGAPIRDRILKLGLGEFGPNMVQVDLLSSEPGALLGPTWKNFRNTAPSGYDVLVYLGHGDLQKAQKDAPPVSQLLLESEDPTFHNAITSKRLATFLADYPIPAVVLAGCLTAANPAAAAPANLATWMRGNQGMAQALVNSASGVLFAVGMRCKVDISDASDFIYEFFANLFGKDKGNLELAVRAARRELYGQRPLSSSWAAPVIFSSLAREPVFEYLSRTGTFLMTPGITREMDLRREVFWQMLSATPPAQRQDPLLDAVAANRQALEREVLKQGAFFMPETVDGNAGQTITVPITFKGSLSCKNLLARISTGPELKVSAVRGKPLLEGRGFRVLTDAKEPAVFQILGKDMHKGPSPVPEGAILEFDIAVSANAGRICAVNLECLNTDSSQPLWSGTSALIVVPVV